MTRLLIPFAFLAIATPQLAAAAAIPTAASARVSQVIEGTILSKSVSRGVPATDQRLAKTGAAVGALTSILTPACYAAGWVSMGYCMVVNAALPVLVAIALNSSTQMITDMNGVAIHRGAVVGVQGSPPATYYDLIQSMGYPSERVYNYTANGQQWSQHFKTTVGSQGHESIPGWNEMQILQVENYLGSGLPTWVHVYQKDYPSGPLAFPPASPADAVKNIPESDVALPASPEVLADLANKSWQQAASSPDYEGLPFNAEDPITPADVSYTLQQTPAEQRPTVGDLIAPALPGNVTQAPGASGTPTQTPTQVNVTVDLGPDPGIAEPALEQTPTGQAIIQPLLDQLNPFRSFNLPPHNSQCPVAVIDFNLHGHPFSGRIDSHCTLWEQHSGLLAAVMTAFWLLTDAFIFLRA